MRKRSILALVICALGALGPVRIASADPTDYPAVQAAADAVDASCKQAYQSGDQCQADDEDPTFNGCRTASWVVEAICDITVPDGEANELRISYATRADQGQEPSFDIRVRDLAGHVIYSDSATGGFAGGPPGAPSPVSVPLWETNGANSASITLSPAVATGAVSCEITGTHTQYGAVFPDAHNTFSCEVQ